ncbi:MAG: hypothetical protein ACOY4R_27825 [Pseudomonadota bacterium]
MPGYFSPVDPREFSEWDSTSPNVARAYERYVAAPSMGMKQATQYGPGTEAAPVVPSAGGGFFSRLIESLFGGGVSRAPTIDQEIADWSRYGDNVPVTDHEIAGWADMGPQYEPQTKITSARDIGQQISAMLGAPQAPPPVDAFSFGVPNQVGPQDFANANLADFLRTIPAPEFSPTPTFPQQPPRQPFTASGWFGRRKAHGGPVGMMRGGYPELYQAPMRRSFFARGGDSYVEPDGMGDGRSDHVEALLSPGEYVMSSEDVALLGDGDNSAGARKLDAMRKNLRTHKGRVLARGKFSPKAKPPESYLPKGAK